MTRGSSTVERRAHNPVCVGATPAPATILLAVLWLFFFGCATIPKCGENEVLKISPKGKVFCHCEGVREWGQCLPPKPEPTPTPEPTPEPTPQPTPEPTPEPTPDPTPIPTPEPTPEPPPPVIPDDPVLVTGGPRPGFVCRDGRCVAKSSCPAWAIGEGHWCQLADLPPIAIKPPPASNVDCLHLPSVAHRYRLELGLLCDSYGCRDAFGRTVKNGVVTSWWNYWKICPPSAAKVQAEPTPEPTPDPTPPPGPAPSSCPVVKASVAPCCNPQGVRLRGEKDGFYLLAFGMNQRFQCPGGGQRGCLCNDEYKGPPLNAHNYELYCGGRKCESVEFEYTATGRGNIQDLRPSRNPYWLWGKARKGGRDTFSIRVCVASGNVDQEGKTLEPWPGNSCTEREYQLSKIVK